MGYLSNFIVYTFAMLGIIGLAVCVFKYTSGYKVKSKGNNSGLKVLETLSLSPRKTLYIVKAGEEKFLIAGDTERTTLISQLEAKKPSDNHHQSEIGNYTNISELYSTNKESHSAILKNIAEKMKI